MSNNYTTSADIVSYGIGRQMGDQLASDPFDGVNASAVAAGLLDALQGTASPIDDATFGKAFQEINEIMQAQQAEKSQATAADGEAFLAENAKKDGIFITESGLQYEILTEGNGDKPSAESTVSTHYHGMLIDGTVFDSSVERGEPTQFPVNRVIPGWTEALQLMPTGSKWRLYIPQNLAYGAQGSGGKIPPYSALVFDVELLEIVA
ncbi:FKBP-type peptidyl-prolyl cis-trans isomerase [Thiomicrorhabdus hydrogeniphila]